MADIIVPWSGNHADIPAGWSRYTDLDDKFPKASGAESAEDTGGAKTHTHTSPSHTHGLNSHTHTFTVNAWSNNDFNGRAALPEDNILNGHNHTGTSGGKTGTSGGTAVTYGSASNNPPYHELIFIKSAIKALPDDAVLLWDQTSAPNNTNYKNCNGGNSTISLNGKYIKSADTGANSGGTGGGTTNTHNLSHSHTGVAHTHSATSSTCGTGRHKRSGGSDGFMSAHSHSFTINSATATPTAYASNLVTAETVEPAYYTLMGYQNKAGTTLGIPLNGIVMTIEAVLPTGFKLCDGNNGTPNLTDKFIKISTSSGDIGNTGGANTHIHASQSHSHTGGTHSHTAPDQGDGTASVDGDGTGEGVSKTGGSHTVTVASTAATFASANTTANSSANQPQYVVVKYIQKTSESGGGFLFLLM